MNDPLVPLNSNSSAISATLSPSKNRPKARRLPSLRDLIGKTSKPNLSPYTNCNNRAKQQSQRLVLEDDSSARTASTRTCSTASTASSILNSDSTIEIEEDESDKATLLNNSENSSSGRASERGPASSKSFSAKTAAASSTEKPQEQPKHARFPTSSEEMVEIVGTIPCLQQLTAQERWETWWCPHEYQAIRLAAKYSTKQVRKCDPTAAETVAICLQQALRGVRSDEDYEAALQDPAGAAVVTTVVLPVGDSAGDSPDETKEPLISMLPWCTSKLPARGLEKYVSQAHKQERFRQVTESRKVVAKLSQSKTSSVQEIAETYRKRTRHSHLFARCMGVADEQAAQLVASSTADENRSRKSLQRSMSDDQTVCSTDTMSSADDSIARAAQQQNLKRSTRRASLSARHSSHTSTIQMMDEAVPPSTQEPEKQQRTPGSNTSNSMSSLQRSFSKRSLFRRHNSQQLGSVATTLSASRSESRRALLSSNNNAARNALPTRRASLNSSSASSPSNSNTRMVQRQESLKRIGSVRSIITTTTNNSSNSVMAASSTALPRQNSKRLLLLQRQESLKRTGSVRRLSPSTAVAGNNNGTGATAPPGSSPRSSSRSRAGGRQPSFRRLSPNATSVPRLERSSSTRGGNLLRSVASRSESPLDETLGRRAMRRRSTSNALSSTQEP